VQPHGVVVEHGQFNSINGQFSIDIPEMPFQTLDLGSEKAREQGIDVGKQFLWRFEKVLFTVTYTLPLDADGEPLDNDIKDMVSGSKKGVLRQNAKIISETPYIYGGFSGTELRYVSQEGLNFICRIFKVGDIGYQVVGGYVDDSEQEALYVLDSFTAPTNPN